MFFTKKKKYCGLGVNSRRALRVHHSKKKIYKSNLHSKENNNKSPSLTEHTSVFSTA